MDTENPFDFSGKTVMLTGAAGGLGRPISLAFAKANAHVAICDLDESALETLASKIKDGQGRIFTRKVDLTEPEQFEGFADWILRETGKVDVLVNLVGGIIRKPSIEYSIEEWQKVIDINLKTCWICCQVLGKAMIEQKAGRIINFSSGAGLYGVPGYPAYSPAKAGIIALTRVLAVEWGPFGICTNAIAPGFIDTPINAEILADKARVERILTRMPLGRVLPEDSIAGPTLFLASDAAQWVNGHTLVVDSGFSVT